MKISQKLVSLRCRVLVKNKRLVVFWLLIKMHVLIAGVKSRRMHLFLLHVSIFKHSKPHAPFFPYVDAGSPCLIPTEVDLTWAVSPLLYQWLMEFASCTGVDICPTKLTVILQASDIGTEERSKLSTASCALAFVTHLVIQHIWLYLHSFIYIAMLKLNKPSADGSNVTLLIGKSNTSSTFWVFQLRVGINSCVTNSTIQTVHDHCQFHSS